MFEALAVIFKSVVTCAVPTPPEVDQSEQHNLPNPLILSLQGETASSHQLTGCSAWEVNSVDILGIFQLFDYIKLRQTRARLWK